MNDRLNIIVNLVNKCNVIADIGTDHAYVPEMLIKNKLCDKVIATDLNYGPYMIAKGYIEAKGLSSQIEIKLGDGFKPIKISEVDTIIMAGMGGLLINKIIEEKINEIDSNITFILQPMSSSEKVREYLSRKSFIIIDEELAKEDYHFYEIIKARKTNKIIYPKNKLFYEVGESLFIKKHKLLKQFIDNKIRINQDIIEVLNKSGKAKERVLFLINKNNEFLEMMERYDIK